MLYNDDLPAPDTLIRVLVVAADPLARAGLSTLLEDRDEIEVIGRIAFEEDAVEDLALYQPDVLIWDMGWDATTAPAAMGEIDLPILALLPDDELAATVWASGATGLLLRDAEGDDLVIAIQAIARDLRVLDPQLAHALAAATSIIDEEPLAEPLTPREQEVLQLLAEGLSNRAIGQELIISEHTVKFHVNAIMGKLDAQSRTEAVVRATRLGLILL